MIPTGGLSVFIHLFINVYAFVAKRVPILRQVKRVLHIPAPVIGGFMILFIVYLGSLFLLSALGKDNNIDHVSFLRDMCVDKQYTLGEKNVILRVDDIQAYAWNDVSKRIIEDARAYDMPLSLAVIPVGLREDYEFYEYLRSLRCEDEFMLHGWDNQEPRPEVGEFAELSEDEAQERLEKGIAVVDRLSRRSIVTFVPPLNQMSSGTSEALDDLQFKIISMEGEEYFDYDVTTFNFNIDELVPTDEVMRGCEETFASGDNLCVIMIHPQDYVTDGVLDQTKYREYELMLKELSESDYNVVRFKDMIEDESGFVDRLMLSVGL